MSKSLFAGVGVPGDSGLRPSTCRTGIQGTLAGGCDSCTCRSLQCVCHLYQFTCFPAASAKPPRLTPFPHLHTNRPAGTCCREGHVTPAKGGKVWRSSLAFCLSSEVQVCAAIGGNWSVGRSEGRRGSHLTRHPPQSPAKPLTHRTGVQLGLESAVTHHV